MSSVGSNKRLVGSNKGSVGSNKGSVGSNKSSVGSNKGSVGSNKTPAGAAGGRARRRKPLWVAWRVYDPPHLFKEARSADNLL
jgi:cobalt-precorrin 5A hydrolase/precorrin-3B C17-methyltransferase